MSGPGPSDGCAKNSIPNYNPNNLFLGHFLRPYFKDKLTALVGPPLQIHILKGDISLDSL